MKVKLAHPPCPTLCDPMDYIVHGILQARILEWVAFPFSRVLAEVAFIFFLMHFVRYIQENSLIYCHSKFMNNDTWWFEDCQFGIRLLAIMLLLDSIQNNVLQIAYTKR